MVNWAFLLGPVFFFDDTPTLFVSLKAEHKFFGVVCSFW